MTLEDELRRWRNRRSRNWIVMNVGSFAIATALAFGITVSFENYDSLMFAPFAGLLVNSVIGTAQGTLLSKHSRRLGLWWTLSTALAGLLGWWLTMVMGLGWIAFAESVLRQSAIPSTWASFMVLPIGGLVMGVSTGFAQMLVLQSHVAKPQQWWKAATVGRLLGWCSAIPIVMLYSFLPRGFTDGEVAVVMLAGLSGALLGLIYGWFTAKVLRQLWQSTIPSPNKD